MISSCECVNTLVGICKNILCQHAMQHQLVHTRGTQKLSPCSHLIAFAIALALVTQMHSKNTFPQMTYGLSHMFVICP